jgi:hypothetical protein
VQEIDVNKMGLQNHIENLRSKPVHVRRRAAFWYAFGITAAIFVFWVSAFTSLGVNAKGTVAQAVQRAGTPAGSLIAGVGSFVVDIKDILFGPKKIEYSTVQVSAGGR